MASIRPRHGVKSTTYQVRYVDQHGRERWKSFKKRRQASEFLTGHGTEVRAGTHIHDRDTILVDDALDIWLTAVKAGRDGRPPAERSTVDQYTSHIRHLKPLIGAVALNKLNGPRARQLRDDLIRGFSRAMAKKLLTSFKSAMTEAQARGHLLTNPCAGVKIIVQSRAVTQVAVPTVDEVRAILRQADTLGPRWRALAYLLPLTGLRPSEVRGLPWAGLADGIRVFQRADEFNKIGPPKSYAGTRTIKIADGLGALLGAWRKEAVYPDGLVFPTSSGKPARLTSWYRDFWAPLLRAAGVAVPVTIDGKALLDEEGDPVTDPKFSIYAMRHFFASMLIHFGANIKELQVEMGHEDPAMTLDIYGHLLDGDAPIERAARSARPEAMWAWLTQIHRPG